MNRIHHMITYIHPIHIFDVTYVLKIMDSHTFYFLILCTHFFSEKKIEMHGVLLLSFFTNLISYTCTTNHNPIIKTPYESIDKSIRTKYPIKTYAPGAYENVQHLTRPYERYVSVLGRGGSLHFYGEFADIRTAAIVSTYASKHGKALKDTYDDLGTKV